MQTFPPSEEVKTQLIAYFDRDVCGIILEYTTVQIDKELLQETFRFSRVDGCGINYISIASYFDGERGYLEEKRAFYRSRGFEIKNANDLRSLLFTYPLAPCVSHFVLAGEDTTAGFTDNQSKMTISTLFTTIVDLHRYEEREYGKVVAPGGTSLESIEYDNKRAALIFHLRIFSMN